MVRKEMEINGKKKDMQTHAERWRCISLLSVVQEVTRPERSLYSARKLGRSSLMKFMM